MSDTKITVSEQTGRLDDRHYTSTIYPIAFYIVNISK
uniref:Uncharacterized protein n=1 Tax=Anguilla anguilla TaxID=7936 RepID=A0A0E9QGJ4_ANGAN